MNNVSLSLRHAGFSPLTKTLGQHSDTGLYARFDNKFGLGGVYYTQGSIKSFSDVVAGPPVGQPTSGGLLIEPAATNLLSGLSYSELTNGAGTITVTENAALAPDGTMTAMRLDFSSSTSGSIGIRFAKAGLSNPTNLAPSLYVKRLSGDTEISLRQGDGSLGAQSLTITDDWTRINSDAGVNAATFFNFDITKYGVYPEMSCLVWGHQLEEGLTVTSYTADTRDAATPALVRGDGSERLTDGGFDNGLSNWSQGGGSFPWAIVDGKATKPVGDAAPLYQSVGLSEDQAEWLKVDVTVNAGSLTIRGGGQTVGRVVGASETIDEIFIPAPGSNSSLVFSPQPDFEGSIDNVSIRKVLPFVGASASEGVFTKALKVCSVPVDGVDRAVLRINSTVSSSYVLLWREGSTGLYRLESFVLGLSQGHVAVSGLDDGGEHTFVIYVDFDTATLSLDADGQGLEGPELIANGSFDTDINNWSNSAEERSTQTWDTGRLKIDATGGNGIAPSTRQDNVQIIADVAYAIDWEASTDDAATTSGYIIGTASKSMAFGMGANNDVFVSTTATTNLLFYGQGFKTVYLDNVSLRATYGRTGLILPSGALAIDIGHSQGVAQLGGKVIELAAASGDRREVW